MSVTIRVDTARFQAALRAFAATSKKSMGTLLREQAKGFVTKVIGLTPPSQGTANVESRKRGERSIDSDLARVFSGKPRSELETLTDLFGARQVRRAMRKKDGTEWLVDYDIIELSYDAMAPFFASKRLANGRVSNAGGSTRDIGRHKADDRMWVPEENLRRFKKGQYAKVGKLAAGWNAAAQDLGARVPAWIARHGSSRGTIRVVTAGGMKIVITNGVKFVGNVRGLRGRVQKALDWQARAMERRVAYYQERAAKAAGLKARG